MQQWFQVGFCGVWQLQVGFHRFQASRLGFQDFFLVSIWAERRRREVRRWGHQKMTWLYPCSTVPPGLALWPSDDDDANDENVKDDGDDDDADADDKND